MKKIIFLIIIFLVGCPASKNEPPVASFTFTAKGGGSLLAPVTVQFDASDPDGDIKTYAWDFGDGNTGEGQQVEHTYTDAGEYKVKLTVTDNKGATNTTTKTVEIGSNSAPVAKNKELSTVQDVTIDITLEATDAEGSALTFTVVAAPQEGEITGNAPNLSYKPKDGFVGSDSFTFKANDGRNDSNVATVSITVLDDSEPNDSSDQAEVLTLGEAKRSFINSQDDVDWFSFELEKEATIAITVKAKEINSSLDPFVALLDKDEKALAKNDNRDADNTDSFIEVNIAAGKYFISVWDSSKGDIFPQFVPLTVNTNFYEITVVIDPCKPDPNAVDCLTGDIDGDGTNNADDPDDNDPCNPNDTVKACTDTIDDDGDGTSKTTDPDDNDPCNPDDTVKACTDSQPTKPDLVVEDLSIDPNSGTIGDNIRIRFKIHNQGEQKASASKTDVRINESNSDVTTSDKLLFSVSTPVINANSSYEVDEAVELPTGVNKGETYIWAIVDVDNIVGQSNVDNDKAKISFTIKGCSSVNFPDGNLETAIRDTLNKPNGNITCDDLEELTVLEVGGKNIADLEGLQHATDLQKLHLQENSINDLEPLKNLTDLQEIFLWLNNVSDLSPLQNLTNLETLLLNGNTVSDLNPIQGLTKLRVVALGRNDISSMSPLQNLTNLEGLYIWGNSISNISPLQDLTKLKILELQGNNISDIGPLQNLTQLQLLNFWDNDISDIGPLQNLTNLEELYSGRNNINTISALQNLTSLRKLDNGYNSTSDLTPIKNLTNLQWISFWENNVSDINALQGLTNLQELYLDHNNISDISPLQNLTNLQKLGFANNSISNLSPIQNLTQLQWLSFWENNISDIGPLQNLTQLQLLNFWDNDISDIGPLQNLTNLEELYSGRNSVTDIGALQNLTNLQKFDNGYNNTSDLTPIKNLTNLQWISFWENNVSDVSALQNLTNLREIHLDHNNISDIQPLVTNSGLSTGDILGINSNCLDLVAGSEDLNNINTLKGRGVDVRYESQKDCAP